MSHNQENAKRGQLESYVFGFVVSITLSVAAYALVAGRFLHGRTLVGALLALAMTQLAVQMICFLHVGAETGRPWKLISFIATMGLVGIIVIGSVWIMSHLNYAMMASPSAMHDYIQDQQGF